MSNEADESHLPLAEQSLVFRLRKRAQIRRKSEDRKSVAEGRADRVADLLDEAATEIELCGLATSQVRWTHIDDALPPLSVWVLVGGHSKKRGAWILCAARMPRDGGGWEWENNTDEPPFATLEFWAPVDEPPPTRRAPTPPPPPPTRDQ